MARSTVIIFGGTGDLSQRKLLPALFNLSQSHSLQVVSVGRRPYTSEQFREEVTQHPTRKKAFPEAAWADFAKHLHYYGLDFTKSADYPAFKSYLDRLIGSEPEHNLLIYLAVPSTSYVQIAEQLAAAGLNQNSNGWVRLLVEKPFGQDEQSAVALGAALDTYFSVDQLYRIDHYLAKETVQNLLATRFANVLLEPVWSAQYIDHIQITAAEEEGVGSRAGYYDQVGAFRDVIQNHLLQLTALLAMDQPVDLSMDGLSDAKQVILDHLHFDPTRTVLGQYQGYAEESNVQPSSQTETYAMTVAEIRLPRWQGMPIYLRTGKALTNRVTEITIQFKPVAENPANRLSFRVQPDEGIDLQLNVKRPGPELVVQPVRMELCYATMFKEEVVEAYERLLGDALAGDRSFSLCERGIQASWRATDQLFAALGTPTIHPYSRGSWGPQAAEQVMLGDGREWLADESEICNGISLV